MVEAHLTLGKDHLGEFAFLCVRADIDYRVVERDGLPAIEFSFVGEDEMGPVSGRGWAVLAADELRGRLFFHRGDDSDFVARREKGRREAAARGRSDEAPRLPGSRTGRSFASLGRSLWTGSAGAFSTKSSGFV